MSYANAPGGRQACNVVDNPEFCSIDAAPVAGEDDVVARIIMAEDDDLVADIARDALGAAGHAVGVLDNGRDALRIIRDRRPDLVILDCNMPELSGLLVLREMRKQVGIHEIPVLILTGRQSENDESLAFFEGADDYLRKPFDPDELVFRVEELLRRKSHN